MIPVEQEKLTYSDYSQLDEGAPYQLIDGELIMSPAPTPRHQRVSARIFAILNQLAESKELGSVYYAPLDVYLSEHETYQPDIIFVSRERASIIGKQKIEGAPDLVVEVLSPATAYYDLKPKKATYQRHGVKEYWIVDPMESTVEIFSNVDRQFDLLQMEQGTGTVESRLLPGFRMDLEGLFAE